MRDRGSGFRVQGSASKSRSKSKSKSNRNSGTIEHEHEHEHDSGPEPAPPHTPHTPHTSPTERSDPHAKPIHLADAGGGRIRRQLRGDGRAAPAASQAADG